MVRERTITEKSEKALGLKPPEAGSREPEALSRLFS
jgi:hypothetical protein